MTESLPSENNRWWSQRVLDPAADRRDVGIPPWHERKEDRRTPKRQRRIWTQRDLPSSALSKYLRATNRFLLSAIQARSWRIASHPGPASLTVLRCRFYPKWGCSIVGLGTSICLYSGIWLWVRSPNPVCRSYAGPRVGCWVLHCVRSRGTVCHALIIRTWCRVGLQTRSTLQLNWLGRNHRIHWSLHN